MNIGRILPGTTVGTVRVPRDAIDRFLLHRNSVIDSGRGDE